MKVIIGTIVGTAGIYAFLAKRHKSVKQIQDSINLARHSVRKQLFQEIAATKLEIRRETKDTFGF